jgi:hypothetical protein
MPKPVLKLLPPWVTFDALVFDDMATNAEKVRRYRCAPHNINAQRFMPAALPHWMALASAVT